MTQGFLARVEPQREPLRERKSFTGEVHPYAEGALKNQITNVITAPEGQRNATLNEAAFELRAFINSGLLDEQTVEDALAAAARGAGLSDHEIRGTIRSGFSGGDAKGVRAEIPEKPSPVSSPHPPGENAVPSAPSGQIEDVWGDLPPVDGADWMFDADDRDVAIWGFDHDILWAEGEALMIAGGMGLGKTTLAGRLVRGLLGLEDRVLNLPIATSEKPILYLAMDRPRQIRRSMKRQFREEDRDKVKGRLIVRPGPPIMDLASCPPLLARMAQEVGAGVVFVDSLKDAVVGLSEDATAAAYNRARQTLLAQGIQICELHHLRKANPNMPSGGIGEVFGSTWLTAGVGSVIILSGEPGDPVVRFRHAKVPADEVGPWRLSHDAEQGSLGVIQIDLLKVVKNAGPNGATARLVAQEMYEVDRPSEAQCKKAQRVLDKLVKQGVLVKMDGHRGGPGGSVATCWFLAPPQELQET